MDVRSLMRQAAHLNSHRPAIIYTDGTTSEHLSFAEAWQRGVRMANALLELDLHPGDRIGVLEDNSIGAQDFFAGAAAGGFVRVPLYARNSVDSHHHMLDHTGCRAVVVADHYLDEIDAVRERLPNL
ncbi:MAG: AMP-binding protein, partial [Actinomycetota bacterium]